MDKNMLGDLDNLPEEDKMRMAVMVDQLQVRDRSTPRPSLIVPLLDPYVVPKTGVSAI
jgi:import inner membrane translocase subunit TIM9